MKQGTLKQLVLYRYRYTVGYVLFVLALIGCLMLAGWGAPDGLAHQERASAVASSQLNISNLQHLDVINLPYRLLQKASINLLGLTQLAIKLPSLILGLISGVGLLFLLRNWLNTGIALVTGLIAVTTGQFLIVSQSGTPTIMLFFWSVFLLLAAIHIARKSRWPLGWKLLLFIAAALSLYTPLSIYVLIMMLISAALHPHLRHVIKRTSKLKLLIAIFVALLLLLPLIIKTSQQPEVAIKLLGLSGVDWSFSTIWHNLISLSNTFFAFANPSINPESMAPLYGAATMALIILGLLRVIIVDHHSARAYTLVLWLAAVTLLLILQPGLLAISFVPLILSLAIGINTLIGEWYKLFPNNPYARISAILPLAILLGSIVYVNIEHYKNSYTYDKSIPVYFNNDLNLVRNQLSDTKGAVTLAVPKSEQSFYLLLKPEYPKLTVGTQIITSSNSDTVILSNKLAGSRVIPPNQIQRIITNSYKNDGLRFYVYRPQPSVIIKKETKRGTKKHVGSSKASNEAKKSSKGTK